MSPAAQGWFDENGDLKQAAGERNSGYMLFDLKDDPEERKDIGGTNHHLVQYGKDLLTMYIKGGNYMEPQDSKRFYLRALPFFHGGTWKPFMSERKWMENYQRSKYYEQQQTVAASESNDDVDKLMNEPMEILHEIDDDDGRQDKQLVDLMPRVDEAIQVVRNMRRRLAD